MKSSQSIPTWGRWLICIILGLILGFLIVASGIIPSLAMSGLELLTWLLGVVIKPILLILAVALYLIPTIIASRSPRLTAILVANIVFGWTIVGWFIILIWALAESGSLNKKPTT